MDVGAGKESPRRERVLLRGRVCNSQRMEAGEFPDPSSAYVASRQF